MNFLERLINATHEEKRPRKLSKLILLCLKKGYLSNPQGLDSEDFFDCYGSTIIQEIEMHVKKCKENGVEPLIEFHKGIGVCTPINYPRRDLSPEENFQRSKHVHRGTVLQRIMNELEGYDFQKFCTKMLKVLGYKCKVGPEGPDNGVDFRGIHEISKEYVVGQVKRWQNNVSIGDLQRLDANIRKEGDDLNQPVSGLFITTSGFSGPARRWVEDSQTHIKLINGLKLSALLVDRDIGIDKTNFPEISLDLQHPSKWL